MESLGRDKSYGSNRQPRREQCYRAAHGDQQSMNWAKKKDRIRRMIRKKGTLFACRRVSESLQPNTLTVDNDNERKDGKREVIADANKKSKQKDSRLWS